jgi:AcrR family transcriptional regulator
MQRARLLNAAVAAVDELGYARATVARITARARVSRRTFYDLFSSREDCLLAVIDDTVDALAAELAVAGVAELGSWRERIRTGLWTVLCFFDREPAVARVCVVQSARGGQRLLERREEILTALMAIVDEGRSSESPRVECPQLTAEGLVGAVLSILYKRLLARDPEPLSSLLPDLMSLLVLPYLGPAAARRERRGIGTFSAGRKGPAGVKSPARLADVAGLSPALVDDPLAGVPMRLTYRTARVLEDVAEHPGTSNRAVAEHAGIADQGQVSKLLARLERIGLLANTGAGHSKGEPNEWRLTPLGLRVTQSIRVRDRHSREAA